ncbi:MAG: TniB family NTP-binding protein [Magnetospirillum sp.]|nr:TniB family NTP-binding protein [Magnetospirillum sp.]
MYDISNETTSASDIGPTTSNVLAPTELDILTNRIAEIRTHYIEFDRLEEIKLDLRRLVMRDNTVSEGGVMALFGCTRSGKTNLLTDFMAEFDEADKARGRVEYEDNTYGYARTVLYVKVPNTSSKNLAEEILKMLGATPEGAVLPATARKGAERRGYDIDDEVIRQCRLRQVRLLILDEVHNSIEDRTAKAAKDVARKIKNYSNACVFSILLVGTDEAAKLLDASDELKARCLTGPLRLVPFDWDKERDRRDCRTLLADFDSILAQVFGQHSGLNETDMAMRICTAAKGVIGHIATLVEDAATKAVRDKMKGNAESVTTAHFARAYDGVPFAEGRPNPFLLAVEGKAAVPVDKSTPSHRHNGGRRATRDTAFRP